MRSIFTFGALSIAILFAGCKEEEHGYRTEHYKEIKITNLQEDVKIPSKAWDLLEFKPVEQSAEGASHENKGEGAKKEGEGESHSGSPNVVFSEVKVFLVQKNPSIVLDGGALKINLPKGGGTIDLANYVSSVQGSFYVGFEFPAFEGASEKRVLFVSSARKRKIGLDIFGSGCNQFFDITDKFFINMQKEGLKVNTTQARYLAVLGGSFLFAAKKNQDIEIAKVTFTHSQYLPLFCEE